MSIGDPKLCVTSFLLGPCSYAYARNQLDDSSLLATLFCTCLPLNRFLIRSAYHIDGSAFEDVIVSLFCFPCAVNQVLQTAIIRRNPARDHAGMLKNSGKWYVPLDRVRQFSRSDRESVDCNLFYSLFMPCCAVGTALENAMDMPLWFGTLCVFWPWTARNILRYQYRIAGDDSVEDCLAPTIGLGICTLCAHFSNPCITLVLYVYPAGLMPAQLLAEVDIRGKASSAYLSSASVPRSQAGVSILRSRGEMDGSTITSDR